MIAYLTAYAAAAVVFAAADAAWLTFAGPRLYQPVIGPLLAEKVDFAAAIVFYLIYLGGILFLAIAPALRDGNWKTAAVNGLVLGVVAYGAYDLTNQATLKLWSTRLTLADMTWGGGMTALAAVAGFMAATRLGLVKP